MVITNNQPCCFHLVIVATMTKHSFPNMLQGLWRSLLLLVLCAVVVGSAAAAEVQSSDRSRETTKDDNIKGAFFGALVSDALCLGSHYEYDARKIKEAYNGKLIPTYMSPGEKMGGQTHGVGWGQRNYHPGTQAGDQTDYGEYNILVLEYLASKHQNGGEAATPSAFSVQEFLPIWSHRLIHNWKQWRCTQTKRALQLYKQKGITEETHLGGPSNAMALRFAAVFAYFDSDTSSTGGDQGEDKVVDAALKSMFTHSETTAKLGCEFFARVTYRILHKDLTPREAIVEVSNEMGGWIESKAKQAIDKVAEATDPHQLLSKEEFVDDLSLTSMARLWDVGKSEPIKVGKASPTEGTLPGSLYFILKYQDDLVAAIKHNAMVGGDNASRAIPVGMVLGAYHGVKAIPEDLRNGLTNWEHCESLLESLPVIASTNTVARDDREDQEL